MSENQKRPDMSSTFMEEKKKSNQGTTDISS